MVRRKENMTKRKMETNKSAKTTIMATISFFKGAEPKTRISSLLHPAFKIKETSVEARPSLQKEGIKV